MNLKSREEVVVQVNYATMGVLHVFALFHALIGKILLFHH